MYLPGEHKVLLSGMDAFSQKILTGIVLGSACCESNSNTFTVTQRAVAEFSDKCMVCILVTPELENVVRDTLLSACQTGNTGDGLLWSVEAQQVQRIRDQQTLA